MRLVKRKLQIGTVVTYRIPGYSNRRYFPDGTAKGMIYAMPGFGKGNEVGVFAFVNDDIDESWQYKVVQIKASAIRLVHDTLSMEEMLASEYKEVRHLGKYMYSNSNRWYKLFQWLMTSPVTITIEEAKCIS